MTPALVDLERNLKNVVNPRVSFKTSKSRPLVTPCRKRLFLFSKNALLLKKKTKKSCRKKKHLL
jgi:hypothetical protein